MAWALTSDGLKEDRLAPIMGYSIVFTRTILKKQTNQCALKLALIGKLLNIPNESENFSAIEDGRRGVNLYFPIYSQSLVCTKHVFPRESGEVWVSEELYFEAISDSKKMSSELVMEFLEAMQRMPAELMMQLLGSQFGPELVWSVERILRSGEVRFEDKCNVLSRSFAIRELCKEGVRLGSEAGQADLNLSVDKLEMTLLRFDERLGPLMSTFFSDSNLLQFLNKHGKRPIPNSNWHNDLFECLVGFEVSFPCGYASHVKQISVDSVRILEQARGHCLNLSQLQFYYDLRNDPARRAVLGTLLSCVGEERHSQFKSALMEAHLLPQMIPSSFMTSRGGVKAVFLSELHQTNMDSVAHFVKTSRVRDKLKAVFGSDDIDFKFVDVSDFLVNEYFYRTLQFRFCEDSEYLAVLGENICMTNTQFFPDVERRMGCKRQLPSQGIFLLFCVVECIELIWI